MTRKLSATRAADKKRLLQIGNRKDENGNPISAVMQTVKSLLPAHKPALHLEKLTGTKEQQGRHLLCGIRRENLELVTLLLRSDIGRDVLFALMGDARPEWFVKYRKSLDVNAAFKQLAEVERAIKRLQMEAAE